VRLWVFSGAKTTCQRASSLKISVPGPLLSAGKPLLPWQILFQRQVHLLGQGFGALFARRYELALQLRKCVEEREPNDQDKQFRQHGGGLMVVTVLQSVVLGQFVEGFVFNAPAPGARLVNKLFAVNGQFLAGAPEPLACLRSGCFLAALDAFLGPLFLGANNPDRWVITLWKNPGSRLSRVALAGCGLCLQKPSMAWRFWSG